MFIYPDNILAWPDPDAYTDVVLPVALQILFTLVARRGVELRKDTLRQLSQTNWNRFAIARTGFTFKDGIETFIMKVRNRVVTLGLCVVND